MDSPEFRYICAAKHPLKNHKKQAEALSDEGSTLLSEELSQQLCFMVSYKASGIYPGSVDCFNPPVPGTRNPEHGYTPI